MDSIASAHCLRGRKPMYGNTSADVPCPTTRSTTATFPALAVSLARGRFRPERANGPDGGGGNAANRANADFNRTPFRGKSLPVAYMSEPRLATVGTLAAMPT